MDETHDDRFFASLWAAGKDYRRVLELVMKRLAADSGTIHLLDAEGVLRLAAASPGIPQAVLAAVRTVPIGKGMAGLAVERREPVQTCNLQTDATGDVRPGARATGLRGAIAVPILKGETAVGALGVGNRTERTFSADEIALLLEAGRRIAAG